MEKDIGQEIIEKLEKINSSLNKMKRRAEEEGTSLSVFCTELDMPESNSN